MTAITHSLRSRGVARFAGLAALLAACSEQNRIVDPAVTPVAPPSTLVIPAADAYVDIHARYDVTCGVRLDGVVNCWGNNIAGAAPTTRTAATGVFTDVATSGRHSCAARSDGKVECWGDSEYGEAPALIAPPSGLSFSAVATGRDFSCARRSNGTVQCWGLLENGLPAEWTASSGSFSAVSATGSSACALNTSGVIECFGLAEAVAPYQFVAATGGFVKVVTTAGTVCGLRTDLEVQCKAPFPSGYALPHGRTLVDFDVNFVTDAHWCGVRADGTIECGGDNDVGQAPATRTASVGSYTRVVVGQDQSCALRTDNRIECWGNPSHGAFTRVFPVATFSAPTSVIVGQPIPISLAGAQLPGFPAIADFTYAFDCGSGFGVAGTASSASCATTTAGVRTVRGRVIDVEGDGTTYSAQVTVKSPAQATSDLEASVAAAGLSPDIRNGLNAKLRAALKAIADGKQQVACSALADFINQVNAQRGKAIPVATADAWLLTAQQLRAGLGC